MVAWKVRIGSIRVADILPAKPEIKPFFSMIFPTKGKSTPRINWETLNVFRLDKESQLYTFSCLQWIPWTTTATTTRPMLSHYAASSQFGDGVVGAGGEEPHSFDGGTLVGTLLATTDTQAIINVMKRFYCQIERWTWCYYRRKSRESAKKSLYCLFFARDWKITLNFSTSFARFADRTAEMIKMRRRKSVLEIEEELKIELCKHS